MGNVRSLPNKIDELCASTRYVNDFRTASLMPFTETWLTDCVSDEHVNIDGFSFIRSDRTELSEKACGGGLGVYVNKKYCHPNNITVEHRSCSPNVEILILSLRPYNLPREFSHVILCTVYVPDRTVDKPAAIEISQVMQDIESSAPDALILINGDFNHCKLLNSGVTYYQHVDCPTRGSVTLDNC